jgi:hypothetical protein
MASLDQRILKTEKYFPELVSLRANCDPKDIYNFEETALFFHMQPDRTLASKLIEGKKKNKERITIGLCVNSTDDKLVPLAIGKHAK